MNEYQNKKNRTAHELGWGQLNLHLNIGSPHAKDFVFEAASIAEDDAGILVAAYLTATNSGWEGDPGVFQWMERAVELSGNDGPLQKMSFKDIIDRKPEWDRRESETWRMLAEGKIPMFMAGQSLNRTLIDLTIFRALANLTEIDPGGGARFPRIVVSVYRNISILSERRLLWMQLRCSH